jgi:hypothetical protein
MDSFGARLSLSCSGLPWNSMTWGFWAEGTHRGYNVLYGSPGEKDGCSQSAL